VKVNLIILIILLIVIYPSYAVETGTIFITSQPVGATVIMDGKNVGNTPLPLHKISKGKHQIKIILKGYKEITKEINVLPDNTITKNFVLQQGDGSIEIKSKPQNARVIFDKTDIGKTPVKLNKVPAGTHLISISMEGYKTYVQKVNVESGETTRINILLESLEYVDAKFSKLTIKTLPPDAFIYIDEKFIGKSPLLEITIETGKHTMKISKTGYKVKKIDMEVKDENKINEIKVSLQKSKNFNQNYFSVIIPLVIIFLFILVVIFKKKRSSSIKSVYSDKKIRSVGKYTINNKIFEDNFFTVYKGKHKNTNNEVFIKLPLTHLVQDPTFNKYFQENMEIWKGLQHPNIVSVYEYGLEKTLYITTEFIKGKNLEEIISENEIINLKQSLDIIYQITLALSYAQAKSVIHGDLKPADIFLTTSGQVKINDFSIYKDLYSYSINSIGFYKGQMQYMAPEKLEKKPLDFRTDLFSLGIILYRLFTGELPFEGDTPHMLLESQYYKEITPMKTFNPEVPDQIQEITLNLIQIDPNQRIKSIEQLIKLLKGIKDNL